MGAIEEENSNNQPMSTLNTEVQDHIYHDSVQKKLKMEEIHQKQNKVELILDTVIKSCQVIYDPLSRRNIQQHEIKLKYYKKIYQYLSQKNAVRFILLPSLTKLIKMVELVLFRPLPPERTKFGPRPREPTVHEMGVPELKYVLPVYAILQKMVETIDPRILSSLLKIGFFRKFVNLFDSSDQKELATLKKLLAELYGRLVSRRNNIRTAIEEVLITLINERFKMNGVGYLLQFFSTVISGFSQPLKEKNLRLFRSVFIPLHKVNTAHLFSPDLISCTVLFLTKDRSLIPEVKYAQNCFEMSFFEKFQNLIF